MTTQNKTLIQVIHYTCQLSYLYLVNNRMNKNCWFISLYEGQSLGQNIILKGSFGYELYGEWHGCPSNSRSNIRWFSSLHIRQSNTYVIFKGLSYFND